MTLRTQQVYIVMFCGRMEEKPFECSFAYKLLYKLKNIDHAILLYRKETDKNRFFVAENCQKLDIYYLKLPEVLMNIRSSRFTAAQVAMLMDG